MKSCNDLDILHLQQRMAEEWYGYGRWKAPYWFVGMEPGGADAEGPARAWEQLGYGDLLDCKEHHLAFRCTKWHTPPYCLQPTWRRLILLLQAFNRDDTSKEALRVHQAVAWGAKAGETCVIELSSIAARSLAEERERLSFREKRIATIREKIAQFRPVFVLMYGKGYRSAWERIAEGAFDNDGMCRVHDTVAMITPAPVAFGRTDTDWMEYGRKLRRRCVEGC